MIAGPLYTVEVTFFSAVLSVIILYLFLRIFCDYMKIRTDYSFFLSVIPFLIFFTLIRILVDINILEKNVFTVSPGIWIVGLFIGFSSFVIFREIFEEKSYAYFFIFWTVPLGYLLFKFYLPIFSDYVSLVYFLGLYFSLILYSYVLLHLVDLWNMENFLVLSGQLIDGVAAFIGVTYKKYAEEHILTWLLMNLFGPSSFVVIKIILPIFILYYLDKKFDLDRCYKNLIKFGIFVLGFAPGFRNLILLLI